MNVPAIRFALFAAGFGLMACQGDFSSEPPIHFNRNMDHQNRFEAQEESTIFGNGRAMRNHVEGTVAVGHLRADPAIHEGKNATGEFLLKLPQEAPEGTKLELNKELLERGRERYQIYCTPCHDAQGSGQGIVVERGMLKPPSIHEDRLLAMPIGQIYNVITYGARNMMPYRSQVSLRDRWAIATYVRALQMSRRAPVAELSPGKVDAKP